MIKLPSNKQRKAKSEVTQSTTNVSGTQTYQDPTQVQPKQDTKVLHMMHH